MASAHDYYTKCHCVDAFRDFDDEDNFLEDCRRARSAHSQNFVVDFSPEQAWSAFDQPLETFEELLRRPRPAALETRWINIWAPDQQQDTVRALASHFDFSPRLTGLMCSAPRRRARTQAKPSASGHVSSWPQNSARHNKSVNTFRSSKSAPAAISTVVEDVEKGRPATLKTPAASVNPEIDLLQNLGHYDVVDSLWHWSSVDLGASYVCLGFNSLYNIDPSEPAITTDPRAQDRPNGTRVWSWLILCKDKTVISIYEPTPADAIVDANGDAGSTRYNLLNVFSQLSSSTDPASRNPISLVPLRFSAGIDHPEGNSTPIDGPGLLFYYLFDDWHTTYSLVAKKGHQYSDELSRVRESMMRRANLSHVTRLHHIGRQLAVLKRLYQSYELILGRLLEKQRAPPADANDAATYSCPSALSHDDAAETKNNKSPAVNDLGVFLTSAAVVRFERLADRIKLYALSEIQECIDLKESLLSMNFNLITIRESDAVERLTRITILLAKVTILFLPVSLMTAYFSTSLDESEFGFSLRSYWISFAVIFFLSFLVLLIFGKLSGTVEGDMVYKSLGQVLWELSARVLGGPSEWMWWRRLTRRGQKQE